MREHSRLSVSSSGARAWRSRLMAARSHCLTSAPTTIWVNFARFFKTFFISLMLEKNSSSWKNSQTWSYSKQRLRITRYNTKKLFAFFSGLSSHPEVIKAAKHTLDTHGAGMSSVRFICGTQDIHRKLEQKIAEFHGREDAILYAACFDANGGIFDVMAGKLSTFNLWDLKFKNFCTIWRCDMISQLARNTAVFNVIVHEQKKTLWKI